jgi:hypothetical protein
MAKWAKTPAELDSQFREISARASALAGSTDAALCVRRPREGSWSVVECIQHLNLSADEYFPRWSQAMALAKRRKGAPDAPYRMDMLGRLLFWALEPPPKLRSTTRSAFIPAESLDAQTVFAEFEEKQQRIVNKMFTCRGLAIDAIKIASPFNNKLRYSVWSSFVVTAAHARRHVWQAEKALSTLREEHGI